MSKRTVFLLLGAILLLGAFFRFYGITEIPLGLYLDEAMNGNNALEALDTGKFRMFYPENNGREGLFINLQAISLAIFGNEPWALRGVSALFGTLTILGVYLLARELFKNPQIALLSSFFLATSFWHINLSRIGFRAILVPFLAAFGTYFLLRGLRTGKIWDMVWAGIFIGLGLHTYIAFRFMPFVLAVPLAWYLWQWWKNQQMIGSRTSYHWTSASYRPCVPCLILLFLFVTFVVALPMGLYFAQNPEDFFGRTGQVSILSAQSPLLEFAKSNLATVGMFFYKGDCNWRHNFNCQPELYWPVAIFFVVGLVVALKNFRSLPNFTLLLWLFFLSLPATLTREGLPHALRSIGMIPPVMILSGIGAWRIWETVQRRVELGRVRRELAILGILLLLLIPTMTFRQYFVLWAHHPETYFAFSTDLLHLGQFLNGLPEETKKYVVVNLPGVEVRGIPMPAEAVMFATDTFREEERQRKNINYILPSELEKITLGESKTMIGLLKGDDREVLKSLQTKFPELKVKAPGDFVVLEADLRR